MNMLWSVDTVMTIYDGHFVLKKIKWWIFVMIILYYKESNHCKCNLATERRTICDRHIVMNIIIDMVISWWVNTLWWTNCYWSFVENLFMMDPLTDTLGWYFACSLCGRHFGMDTMRQNFMMEIFWLALSKSKGYLWWTLWWKCCVGLSLLETLHWTHKEENFVMDSWRDTLCIQFWHETKFCLLFKSGNSVW